MTAEEIKEIGEENVEDLLYGIENCRARGPEEDKRFIGYIDNEYEIEKIIGEYSNKDEIDIDTKAILNLFYNTKYQRKEYKEKILKRIRMCAKLSNYEKYNFKDEKMIIENDNYRLYNTKRELIYLLEFEKMYTEYIMEFNLVAKTTFYNTNYPDKYKIVNFCLNTKSFSENQMKSLVEMLKYNKKIIDKINYSFNEFNKYNDNKENNFFIRK